MPTPKANTCICGHHAREHAELHHGSWDGHGKCTARDRATTPEEGWIDCDCPAFRPTKTAPDKRPHTHSGAAEAPTHQPGRRRTR